MSMSKRVKSHETLSDRDRALFAGLADGTLSGRRLARAQKHLRSVPDGAAQLERQRRVARALRGGPVAPPSLNAVPAVRPRMPRFRGHAPLLAILAAAAASAGLVVAVLPRDGPPAPADAAELAQLEPERPPPATSGALLRADVQGVVFPDWSERGWHEVGARSDRLGDRPTRTVYYEHMGHRIAYTIVSGPALAPPSGARRVRRDGIDVALYRDPRHGGHDVAVFERGGHTCVLAGHVLHTSTLVELATWSADGAVRF